MAINCVSDAAVIININMGIRNVTWGEGKSYQVSSRGGWFVTVNYKNGNNTFYYPTEELARAMFNKIRDAMITNRTEVKGVE